MKEPYASKMITFSSSPPTGRHGKQLPASVETKNPQWMKSLESRYWKLHEKIYSYGDKPGNSIRQNLRLSQSNSSQVHSVRKPPSTSATQFVSLSKDKYQKGRATLGVVDGPPPILSSRRNATGSENQQRHNNLDDTMGAKTFRKNQRESLDCYSNFLQNGALRRTWDDLRDVSPNEIQKKPTPLLSAISPRVGDTNFDLDNHVPKSSTNIYKSTTCETRNLPSREQKQHKLFSQMSFEARQAILNTPDPTNTSPFEPTINDRLACFENTQIDDTARTNTVTENNTVEIRNINSSNAINNDVPINLTPLVMSNCKENSSQSIDSNNCHDNFKTWHKSCRQCTVLPNILETNSFERHKNDMAQDIESNTGGFSFSQMDTRLGAEREETFEITPFDYDLRYRNIIRCGNSSPDDIIHQAQAKCLDWLNKYNPKPEPESMSCKQYS